MEDHPLLASSPYPRILADGRLVNGYSLSIATYCEKKCSDHACKEYGTDLQGLDARFFTCPHGFSVALARWGTGCIRVPGVLEISSNASTPRFRKNHKHRKIKSTEFQEWIANLRGMLPEYERQLGERVKESILALHDVKSLIGNILGTTEEWIFEHNGYNIDDKLENCPNRLRTIYHSCRILESLFQMTDIVANPAAATFGAPSPVAVHGVMFMLNKIFEAKAAKLGISIKLSGNSYNRPRAYKSFIIVPFVLMDNAVKYARRNSQITISVSDDRNRGVEVEVSSHGELVPSHQRKFIFDRGFRGNNAKTKGSGLGLFIAQEVARANGFSIQYQGNPSSGSITEGTNRFSFSVDGITQK